MANYFNARKTRLFSHKIRNQIRIIIYKVTYFADLQFLHWATCAMHNRARWYLSSMVKFELDDPAPMYIGAGSCKQNIIFHRALMMMAIKTNMIIIMTIIMVLEVKLSISFLKTLLIHYWFIIALVVPVQSWTENDVYVFLHSYNA